MNNRGGVLWDENEVSDHNVSRLQQNTIAETKITELPTFETPPQTPVCEPPVSNPPPPSTSSATTPTSTLSSLYSHFYPASSPSSSPPNKPVPTSSTPSFLFPSTTFLFASSPSPPALLQSPSGMNIMVHFFRFNLTFLSKMPKFLFWKMDGWSRKVGLWKHGERDTSSWPVMES